MSLLYKNPKWTRNSDILFASFTIHPRPVGQYMLSLRRDALPKSSPTSRAPLHRHTLEFGTITNLQHLKSRSFFPNDIEHCIKVSCRKWLDKFFADQERPPIPSIWHVKFGTNLTRPEILKLDNVGFQFSKKKRITSTRPNFYPSSRQSKTTRRSTTAPSAN